MVCYASHRQQRPLPQLARPSQLYEIRFSRLGDGAPAMENLRMSCIVEAGPSELDLLQLAQHLVTEVLNGALIAGFGRVHSELPVQLTPCKAL